MKLASRALLLLALVALPLVLFPGVARARTVTAIHPLASWHLETRSGFAFSSPHQFNARITVTGTQGTPTSKGIPGSFTGRGRSPQFGRISLTGNGYQRQGPGDLQDDMRGRLAFASGGSISVHITGTEHFTNNMTTVIQKARFTVTGGKGPYAHATGKGTIDARCPNDPNAASLSCPQIWTGTVRY